LICNCQKMKIAWCLAIVPTPAFAVIAYVEKLEQVDVTGVEPTTHDENAIFNVFPRDASRATGSTA